MAAEGSSASSGGELDIERGLIRTTRGYMHYRAAGSGRPIFMIHTHHRNSEFYLPIIRMLAPEYRCYAMDLPCCGFSDHLQNELTLEDYIASITEVIHSLGLRDIVAMGQARGSHLCTVLATTEPDLMRGLILQNSPYYPAQELQTDFYARRQAILPLDETGFPKLLSMADVLDDENVKIINRPRNPTQEWLDEENRSLVLAGRDIWNGLDAIRPIPRGNIYERITCPTLLVWGKDFAYGRNRDGIIRQVKNARVALIPDAGFFLHLDQPEAYREAVTSFLRDLP